MNQNEQKTLPVKNESPNPQNNSSLQELDLDTLEKVSGGKMVPASVLDHPGPQRG